MTEATTANYSPGALVILQAAGELFAERGFDGVSANDIAQHAGVSKANVFHHFACKDDLYMATLRRASMRNTGEVEAVLTGCGSHADKLRGLLQLTLKRMVDKPEETRLILREAFENGHSRGQKLAQQVFRDSFSAELSLFIQGQKAGEFRRDLDPMLCWMTLISAALFYFQGHNVLRHHPEFNFSDQPGAFAQQCSDLLLHGLLEPKRSTR